MSTAKHAGLEFWSRSVELNERLPNFSWAGGPRRNETYMRNARLELPVIFCRVLVSRGGSSESRVNS
jgi:hypothetical protein